MGEILRNKKEQFELSILRACQKKDELKIKRAKVLARKAKNCRLHHHS